eukprot:11195120-Lingulodinium_polyedra.AAC.1
MPGGSKQAPRFLKVWVLVSKSPSLSKSLGPGVPQRARVAMEELAGKQVIPATFGATVPMRSHREQQ